MKTTTIWTMTGKETKKMKMRNWIYAGLAALLTGVWGCDRGPTLSELEARERSSRLFSNAMDDLNAGRVDAAIAGFERVVRQEPNAYSAHFQLATLLQDMRKDYIGAIVHYREYLALRPESDKATVAQDRLKTCTTLLEAEIVRKEGGRASDKLAQANDLLQKKQTALETEVARLKKDLAAAQADLDKATQENKKFRNLVSKFSEGDTGAPRNIAAKSAREALAELKRMEVEEKRRRVRPTDAELLDEDDEPAVSLAQTDEVKQLVAEAAAEDQADANKPQTKAGVKGKSKTDGGLASFLPGGPKKKDRDAGRPATYTVQAGDTLFSISKRFYGTNARWRDIRDANRLIIPQDGRVRQGQEIKLP